MEERKNILIIYTGGTIGMVKSKQGEYIPSPGYLGEIVTNSYILKHPSMPKFDILEHKKLIDSSDTKPQNWQVIATDIKKNYHKYDGFIVLHGTDTLAYTASALSFMLNNLNKPVIVTGAQIPLSEIRTDGIANILGSLILIANYPNIREVCVYFNKRLLRGNRAKKISSDDMNAFDSPNYPLLAKLDIDIKVNNHLLLPVKQNQKLEINNFGNAKIAMLSIFPGIDYQFLDQVLQQPLAGLVLRTYGAGNAPSSPEFLSVLKSACQKGIIIVNCTSCHSGIVDMRTYSTGRTLLDIGVVSGYDMTEEAALTKLYYLYGLSLPINKIKENMQQNIRGELTLSVINNVKLPNCVISNLTDPYTNLGIENWIFKNWINEHPVLFLWQSQPALIIGRAQNPWLECNLQTARHDGLL